LRGYRGEEEEEFLADNADNADEAKKDFFQISNIWPDLINLNSYR
jgi:hypothetical protein